MRCLSLLFLLSFSLPLFAFDEYERRENDIVATSYTENGPISRVIGSVRAEPFSMVWNRRTMFARMGEKIYQFRTDIETFEEVGLARDPFDMVLIRGSLITREANEMHRYDFRTQAWSVIGGARDPFQMITMAVPAGPQRGQQWIVTREGESINVYNPKDNSWRDNIGRVGETPFDMRAVGPLLITREGESFYTWSVYGGSTDWTRIGNLSDIENFRGLSKIDSLVESIRRGIRINRRSSGSFQAIQD